MWHQGAPHDLADRPHFPSGQAAQAARTKNLSAVPAIGEPLSVQLLSMNLSQVLIVCYLLVMTCIQELVLGRAHPYSVIGSVAYDLGLC